VVLMALTCCYCRRPQRYYLGKILGMVRCQVGKVGPGCPRAASPIRKGFVKRGWRNSRSFIYRLGYLPTMGNRANISGIEAQQDQRPACGDQGKNIPGRGTDLEISGNLSFNFCRRAIRIQNSEFMVWLSFARRPGFWEPSVADHSAVAEPAVFNFDYLKSELTKI
jgi:hypothetical protein